MVPFRRGQTRRWGECEGPKKLGRITSARVVRSFGDWFPVLQNEEEDDEEEDDEEEEEE